MNNHSGKYTATLYFKNGSKEFEEIPSPNEASDFKKWVASAFLKIANTNVRNDETLAQERAKAAQQIKEFELQKKKEAARRKAEEAELNKSRMTNQIAYYIWEATDIRSAYENNSFIRICNADALSISIFDAKQALQRLKLSALKMLILVELCICKCKGTEGRWGNQNQPFIDEKSKHL